MRVPFLAVLIWIFAAAAQAATPDAATQQRLLAVYDAYAKAMAAGKLDAAMATMSDKLRDRARNILRTDQDRAKVIAMARDMAPETTSVLHGFIDEKAGHARLILLTTRAGRRGGMTLGFLREKGTWKLDDQEFGDDPTAVTGCRDETAAPPPAYNAKRPISIGGRIVRVDFRADATLVVLNVLGDPACIFLPAKANLAEMKLDPAGLLPYATLSVDGIAHRGDPQRILATRATLRPEE